jgi:hypothetical protein
MESIENQFHPNYQTTVDSGSGNLIETPIQNYSQVKCVREMIVLWPTWFIGLRFKVVHLENFFWYNFSLQLSVLQDVNQYQHDLERSNVTFNQQEDLLHILTQRNDEIDRSIQQRRQQINELENDLIKLDDLLINSKSND